MPNCLPIVINTKLMSPGYTEPVNKNVCSRLKYFCNKSVSCEDSAGVMKQRSLPPYHLKNYWHNKMHFAFEDFLISSNHNGCLLTLAVLLYPPLNLIILIFVGRG